MKWNILKGEDSNYWAIQSVLTDEYLDVENHPPVDNDAVVVVKIIPPPYIWDIRSDGQ
jgi:hypothetical protein